MTDSQHPRIAYRLFRRDRTTKTYMHEAAYSSIMLIMCLNFNALHWI